MNAGDGPDAAFHTSPRDSHSLAEPDPLALLALHGHHRPLLIKLQAADALKDLAQEGLDPDHESRATGTHVGREEGQSVGTNVWPTCAGLGRSEQPPGRTCHPDAHANRDA